MRAIIVDDDLGFAKILERRLKGVSSALEVSLFDSLTAVRNHLKRSTLQTFDFVVLDQHLPDGNGVEFLKEGWFKDLAVLVMSSDQSPEIAGKSVSAGAAYFLHKSVVTDPLFLPLVKGLMDRNRLQNEIVQAKISTATLETVKTLVSTLRHEINNPLGAVLGAAYVLKAQTGTAEERSRAGQLIEESGKRIKDVLNKLCRTVQLEPETKAGHVVFKVPGDEKWEKK